MPPDKKPAEKSFSEHSKETFNEVVLFFVVLLFISIFINRFISFFDTGNLFSNGITPHGMLLSLTEPISSINNPIGRKVVVVNNNSPLFNTPGVKQIGTKNTANEGVIIAGPMSSLGARYWKVKFNDGSVGWISEQNIRAESQKTSPLSSVTTAIGGKVIAVREVKVLDLPAGKEIAVEKENAKGVILDGPLVRDGIKYWQIRFDDGVPGFVDENDLNYIKSEEVSLSSIASPKGGRVSVLEGAVPVYSQPALNQIGLESKEATGVVIDGPSSSVSSGTYWKVQFDDGTVGWVLESSLSYITTTTIPLSGVESYTGKSVLASRDGIVVYDSPNGNKIGTKKGGSHANIVEGPIIVDGTRYWHVKFDDGVDGWVREDDLDYVNTTGGSFLLGLILFYYRFIRYLKYLLVLITLILIVFMAYLRKEITKISHNEKKLLYPEMPKANVVINPRWQKILDQINSGEESNWRFAIMEADIMLDDLLEKLALPGETIGEKLQAVEKSDFLTIDNAWEAHKVRNQIAHDGSSFQITQREAKRVIELYKTIFDEFKMI